MFLEAFKGDSRELQEYLKEVQRGFQGIQGSFKGRKCQVCVQENIKISFEGVSRMFLCSFVAWISSQLPEQKEGLLIC